MDSEERERISKEIIDIVLNSEDNYEAQYGVEKILKEVEFKIKKDVVSYQQGAGYVRTKRRSL